MHHSTRTHPQVPCTYHIHTYIHLYNTHMNLHTQKTTKIQTVHITYLHIHISLYTFTHACLRIPKPQIHVLHARGHQSAYTKLLHTHTTYTPCTHTYSTTYNHMTFHHMHTTYMYLAHTCTLYAHTYTSHHLPAQGQLSPSLTEPLAGRGGASLRLRRMPCLLNPPPPPRGC